MVNTLLIGYCYFYCTEGPGAKGLISMKNRNHSLSLPLSVSLLSAIIKGRNSTESEFSALALLGRLPLVIPGKSVAAELFFPLNIPLAVRRIPASEWIVPPLPCFLHLVHPRFLYQ
ncbi:hypothetical protein XELAEV_18008546mg [Xenopus laevis]|uniref:Uncharacterized protein n=1 Tax=Xenopus laevis TaxID=8355 RepID=A0A974E2T7_XENLA|nr:hypothetical protein XELAEV_18008546mg [Xenopus laevis]